MHSKYSVATALLLTLDGCAINSNVSVAGLYSAAHTITIEGIKVKTEDYINVDPTGKMTVYVSKEPDDAGPEKCYVLASGTDIDASLQGRTLKRGTSPMGDAAYEVRVGVDTFGILTEPNKDGSVKWFFHFGGNNSTATVKGAWNVAKSGDQSYSISGPPLTSPAVSELQSMLCSATYPDKKSKSRGVQ